MNPEMDEENFRVGRLCRARDASALGASAPRRLAQLRASLHEILVARSLLATSHRGLSQNNL